jgi:aminopeptidase N
MRTPPELNPIEYDSAIIYEKGALFMHTLESIIRRERFDEWLRGWFDRHAFEPATSEMFIAELRDRLVGDDAELDRALMLEEWIYGTGLPSNALRPDPAAFAQVDAAVAAYAADRALEAEAWRGWTTAEQKRFLSEVPAAQSDADLARLDMELGLSGSGNNEILFLWLELAMKNWYQPAIPQVEEFLARVGRNKFVSPLYQAMWDSGDQGRRLAQEIYAINRSSYHDMTRGNVDRIVGWRDE